MNKKMFFVYVLNQILYSIITVGFAYFMMRVTDSLVALDKTDFFTCLILAVAGLALQLLTGYISAVTTNKLINQKMSIVKKEMFGSVLSSHSGELTDDEQNHYLNFFTKELELYENNYVRVIFTIIGSAITLAFSMAMICYINPLLCIVAVALLCIMLILPVMFSSKLGEYNDIFINSNDSLLKCLREVLGGYSVIKSYLLENKIMSESAKKVDSWSKDKTRFENKLGMVNSITAGLSMAIIVCCFLVGGILILEEMITIGALLALIQLITNMISPLTQILYGVNNMNSTKNIRDKIQEYRQSIDKDEIQDFSMIKNSSEIDKIVVKNLKYKYPTALDNVLDDVTIEFKKGCSYAIVGENGCGKSTFAKLLAGMVKPDEGIIEYKDKSDSTITGRSVQKNITYIHQNSFLFDVSPKDNCTLLSTVDFDEKLGEKMDCESLLSRDDSTEKLSGGERQKIAFIRGVNRGTPVLICDECEAAMDIQSKQLYNNMIEDMQDKIRICITHNLDDRLEDYDEILFFKNGAIKEQGTFKSLYQNQGEFYDFYKRAN